MMLAEKKIAFDTSVAARWMVASCSLMPAATCRPGAAPPPA